MRLHEIINALRSKHSPEGKLELLPAPNRAQRREMANYKPAERAMRMRRTLDRIRKAKAAR